MKQKLALLIAALFLGQLAAAAESASRESKIKRIYLAPFSHTDYGYTDLQSVCRDLHRRYLDVALDAILATMSGPRDKKFYWTAEAMIPVQDWWDAATPQRRADFLKAVRSGQLAIAALPLNLSPSMGAAEWKTMLHWIPEPLWQKFKPAVAIQNDIMGFPRAGAIALLDRGVHRLFMGSNSCLGGPPMPPPSAFWWKMPDGRRVFVWIGYPYPTGYTFFEPTEWRRGPIPSASDATFRPPHEGDIFRTDEASLRASNQICLKKIKELEHSGYDRSELFITITNQWRIDNDPPLLLMTKFVAEWNRLKLQPELRLTTADKGLEAMERVWKDKAPVYEGEFTDWWAFGIPSAPREVSGSRRAKRLLAAVQSPVFGPLPESAAQTVDKLYKDLCLFDEHTWGADEYVAYPWTLNTKVQEAEKLLFALRPMAHAEWLLSRRVRTRFWREGEGLFVVNPTRAPFSGWVTFNTLSLRDDKQPVSKGALGLILDSPVPFKSLAQPGGGPNLELKMEKGPTCWGRPEKSEDLTFENSPAVYADNGPIRVARFWVDKLDGNSFMKLTLSKEAAKDQPSGAPGPKVTTDGEGWPTSAQWPGMSKPLFESGIGDFIAVQMEAFAPRWVLFDMAAAPDMEREALRKKTLRENLAAHDDQTVVTETAHTLLFTQALKHPRLRWATRKLELWKDQPRARLTLRFYRISSDDPEVFYAAFPLPCKGVAPRLSAGGVGYTPFKDQIPGSCADHYAIDGWADYATPDGHWLWVSRDAPMISLGHPQIWTKTKQAPDDANRMLSMMFNNQWFCNFNGDEHGIMEFTYDLVWRKSLEGDGESAKIAEGLMAEPVLMQNDKTVENPMLMDRLFRP